MAQAKMDLIINTELNKAGFNELRKEIQSLKSITGQDLINLGQANSLKEAEEKIKAIRNSVSQMETALNKAFNPKLGTVNLQRFEKEILSMGLNVKTIATDFSKLGAQGQTAFRNIAASALTASTNIRESHEWLSKMGETMMNTVKWGISSSVWNTMTGSLEKAYSYAKNLDKSLNNIRIVSGQSADQMDRFAIQANKAAKQLGKTTLDYTNAALIYYQQGLSEEEVAKRTEATIKMANVTGEAAKDVSDYMTAVWNNFYDGSKSLEYYADVMTALGAATASSTDEIAAGLEKFAAIADTVGLSYEYATSALATVTAETRQSADTVGTAFKTLFARIQDLELGETLDDGTTLGKYSEALNKVGINIMDSNHELKDMDDILNEMGSKWETLTKAQQVSLAQTVAGTRQYAQLVALMDNWDVFQTNLSTAANATGELNKQQEIYLESTQAHLNELQAATERVYKSLIDSEGLNDLIDIFTGLVEGVANYTEALGGSKSVLNQFGGIALKVFGKNLSKEISTIALDIKHIGDNADEAKAKTRLFETIFKDANVNDKEYQKLMDMVGLAQEYKDVMTKDQQEQLNALILRRNEIANEKDAWEQNVEAAKKYYKTITGENLDIENINIGNKEDYIKSLQEQYSAYENKFGQGAINVLKDTNFGTDLSMAEMYMSQAEEALKSGIIKDEKIADALQKSLDGINGKIKDTSTSFSEEQRQIFIEDFKKAYGDAADHILKESKNVEKVIEKAASGMANAAKNSGEDIEKELKDWEFSLKVQSLTKGFTDLTSNIMMISSAIDSIKSVPKIWDENNDLSTGERILQTIMAVGNAINGVVQSASAISNIAKIIKSVTASYAIKTGTVIASEEAEQKATKNTTEKIKIKNEKFIESGKSAYLGALKVKASEDLVQDELDQSIEKIEEKSKKYSETQKEDGRDAKASWDSKTKEEKKKAQEARSQNKALAHRTFVRGVNTILENPDADFSGYKQIPLISSDQGINEIRKVLRGSGVGLNQKEIEDIRYVMKMIDAQTTQIANGEKEDFYFPEENSKQYQTFKEKMSSYQYIKKGYYTPKELKELNLQKTKEREKREEIEEIEEPASKTGFIQDSVKAGKEALGKVKSDAQYILGFLTKIPVTAWISVAAITAIGAVIYSLATAAKRKEEELQNDIKKTKEVLDQTTESYNTLTQNISNYTEAKKGIESLTEGTADFNAAIIEANQHALELIDSLGLVAGQDYTLGTNGLININEDALEEKKHLEQRKQYSAQIGYYGSQIKYLEESDIGGLSGFYKNLAKDINDSLQKQKSDIKVDSNMAKIILTGEIPDKYSGYLQSMVSNTEGIKNVESDTSNLGSILDVTDAISKNIDKYNKINSQIQTYNRLASDASIRGYADAGALDAYNKATKKQQEIEQDYITKERQKYIDVNKETAENAKEHSIGEQYLIGALNVAGRGLDWFDLSGSWKRYKETMTEWAVENQNALEIREAYAKNVEGWEKQENGAWVDKSGKEQDLSTIDLDIAKNAVISGEYAAINATKDFEEIRADAYIKAQNLGVTDIDSLSYITEGITALKTYGEAARKKSFTDGIVGAIDTIGQVLPEDWKQSFKENPYLSKGYDMMKKKSETDDTFDNSKAGYDFMALTDEELDIIKEIAPEYVSYIDLIKESTDRVGQAASRAQQDLINYTNELSNQAAAQGASEKALHLYAEATIQAEKSLKGKTQSTARAAAEEYKFNKLYNDGVKTFEDNEEAFNIYIKALKKGEKVSYDVADATAEIQEKLESVLGFEVDSEFLKNNSELINTLFTGTEEEAEEAYEKLKNIGFEKAFRNLAAQAEMSETEINKFWATFQDIQSSDTGLTFNAKTDDFISQLNRMMGETLTSVDDVQTWLDNHGLKIKQGVDSSVAIKKYTTEGTSTKKTHIIHSGGTNPFTGDEIKKDIQWEETVKTDPQVYYALTNENEDITFENAPTNFTNFQKSNNNSGGSGSKSKSSKAADYEANKDPYYKVNQQLEEISNTLSELETQQERLIGGDLINNYTKQLKVLNAELDVTNDKLKIANSEQKRVQNELSKYNVKFDKYGLVTNYSKIFDKELEKFKAVENKYLKNPEKYQEQYDKAVERFEKINSLFNEYNDVLGTQYDMQERLEELRNQIIEKQIDAFNLRVEVTFEFDDARKQWNDFEKEILNDFREDRDFVDLSKFEIIRVAQLEETVPALIENINKTLNDYNLSKKNKIMSIFGVEDINNEALLLEHLNEMISKGIDVVTQTKEAYSQVREYWLASYDATEELVDKQIEMMDMVVENYQHNIRLIELTKGENSYSDIRLYQNSIAEMTKKIYENRQETTTYFQRELIQLKTGTEEWEAVHEKYISAIQEEQAALESYLEATKEAYVTTLNDIFETLRSGFAGGLSTSYIEQEWDLANKYAEKYFDTINRGYESQKIEDEFQDLLDKYQDSATTQSRIKKIMDEQMKILQEQDKLSQYDIDRARLKIQLLEQEIALEEARDNKNKMRLRRDSQGNYSYQYVADEDAVKEAEAARRDKANELYNFDKENLIRATEERNSLLNDFQSAMIEALQIEDESVKNATIAMLEERYQPLLDESKNELEQIVGNIQESAEEAIAITYGEDSAEMMAFRENPLEWILGDTGLGSGMLDFVREIPYFEEWYGGLKDKFQPVTDEYQAKRDEITEKIADGETLLSEQLESFANIFEAESEEMKDQTEALAEEMGGLKAALERLEPLIEALAKANKANEEIYSNSIKEINAGDNNIRQQSTTQVTSSATNKTSTDESSLGTASNGAPIIAIYKVKKGDTLSGIGKKYGINWKRIREENGIGKDNLIYPGDKLKIPKYDTGGYTGNWFGDSGQFAMLHKKELVLNKQDTENLLNTVGIVRQLTQNLGGNAFEQLARMARGQVAFGATDTGVLQQQVSIEANFPNVEHAGEIEEALNNLVNAASQKAGYKDK